MDPVVIPHALLVFYGALVLGCGSVLGFIAGRNRPRRVTRPDPPDRLERRVSLLEHELEDAQNELMKLTREREFMRELRAPDRQNDTNAGFRRIA